MVDMEAISRAAARRVRDPVLREDVVQTACLYALTHREAAPWQYVVDALRREMGRARVMNRGMFFPTQLEHPEWIAGRYATPEELGERLFDETTEDELEEWRKLPAADRDQRVRESGMALGSSVDRVGPAV